MSDLLHFPVDGGVIPHHETEAECDPNCIPNSLRTFLSHVKEGDDVIETQIIIVDIGTRQQRSMEQYSRALVAANDKLRKNYNRHQDYSQRLAEAKDRQEALCFEVETAAVVYENYRNSLGETDSATISAKQNMERYQQKYTDATVEVTKLDALPRRNRRKAAFLHEIRHIRRNDHSNTNTIYMVECK